MRDKVQSVEEFIDENNTQFNRNGQSIDIGGSTEPKQESSDPDVYYEFSASRRSVTDLAGKTLKAGQTALETGLAVDDLMERRRRAKRQVRRQNMTDGLRIIGWVADALL